MRLIIWAALLCGLMFFWAAPVMADYTLELDFDNQADLTYSLHPTADASASVVSGGRTGNALWDSATWGPNWQGGYVNDLNVTITPPENCNLLSLTYWYAFRNGTGADAIINPGIIVNGRTPEWGTAIKSFDQWFERTMGYADLGFSEPPLLTSLELVIYFYNQGGGDYVAMDDISITCSGSPPVQGGLTRPIAPPDRAVLSDDVPQLIQGMFSIDLMETLDPVYPGTGTSEGVRKHVFALANMPDVSVLSVQAGTVESISPISVEQCKQWTIITIMKSCYVYIEDEKTLLGKYYAVDVAPVQKVVVQFSATLRFEYLVNNPKVSVGDTILAGCIVGSTVNLTPIFGFELSITGGGIIPDISLDTENRLGVAVVRRMEDLGNGFESTDLLDLLTEDRDALQACNVNTRYRACAGDGELRTPESWSQRGLVQWDPDGTGAILQPGASIVQTLALDDSQNYAFNVQARPVGDYQSARMQLQLGETLQQFTGFPPGMITAIPYGLHSPDVAPLYSVGIYNNGSVPLEIVTACVRSETVSAPVPSCVFSNHSFDYGLSDWQTTGTVNLGVTEGQIWAETNSTIGQSITLYPNGAQTHEYNLLVEVTVPPAFRTGTGDVTMTYTWNGQTTALSAPNSQPNYPFSNFTPPEVPNGAAWSEDGYVRFRATIPVTQQTTGVMSIGTLLINGAPQNAGVLIGRVCIDNPLQPPEEGFVDGVPYEMPLHCETPALPTNRDQFGDWIIYLWGNLDKYFRCDLNIMLGRMFNQMYQGWRFIQWQMLYQQASASQLSRWLSSDLFPWLAGYFRNMAVGQVTVFQQAGGGQCSDVFCLLYQVANLLFSPISDLVNGFVGGLNNVLDTLLGILRDIVDTVLNLVNQAASLLFGIISALLTIALQIITEFIRLILMARDLLLALVGAYNNATPQTIQGMPNCQINPRNQGWCVFIYVVDNTLLAGARGTALIAIIISILSALLLIWGVKEIRNVVLKVRVSA